MPDLATVVQTAATVALAFFGGVQVWREHRHKQERRLSAQARISALAFLSRRQIRTWLGSGGGSVEEFEEWVRAAQNDDTLPQHLAKAEARFVDLLELAADLNAPAAASVRSSAVYFFAGVGRLTNYVTRNNPGATLELSDFIKLRNDAWNDLRDCIRLLDDRVGASVLLQESRLLDAKRNAEDPPLSTLLERVGNELARLEEQREQPTAQ